MIYPEILDWKYTFSNHCIIDLKKINFLCRWTSNLQFPITFKSLRPETPENCIKMPQSLIFGEPLHVGLKIHVFENNRIIDYKNA